MSEFNPPSPKDQRRDPRAPKAVMVNYRLRGSAGVWSLGQAKDISASGVAFRGVEPFTKGAQLELRFTVPSTLETVTVSGTIVWVKVVVPNQWYDYGVALEGLSPERRAALSETVRQTNRPKASNG